MSSSPQTPRHSPHPSLVDFPISGSSSPLQERRYSKSSSYGASTPLRGSFNREGIDVSIFRSGSGGLGNLADELAGALSEGEDEDDENEGGASRNCKVDDSEATKEGTRDSGVDVGSPGHGARSSLSLPVVDGRGNGRAPSEYDGSEYGSDSDLESPGMPPSLVARIDAVDSLARRGMGNNGSPIDGTFQRVTDGLRDLGSQAGVEGGATRLITAHSALTAHLSHQTRQLHNLTYPLLSPLVTPPDHETVDALLPMLVSLSENLPRPSMTAYHSLSALHNTTVELVQTLNYLSDTLHMSRQTTTTATRRLRSARDLVTEMRREDVLREEGEQWIRQGNWGERLQRREAASVCSEVVGGFEQVCDDWRRRLLAQSESTPA